MTLVSRKLKILQIVSFLSPKRGGGVIAVADQVSRALANRGHQVTIYTSDFELDQLYLDSFKNINIYTFPCHASFRNRPLIITGVVKQIKKQINEFDVIHMHDCRGMLSFIVQRFALKNNIPYIVDAHGVNINTWGIFGLIDRIFTLPVLRNATMTIAETSLGTEELKDVGIMDAKISLLYPPFPVDDYALLPQKGLFKTKYNIQGKHLLLFLGRLNWIKGLDYLIESFKLLYNEQTNVVLVVVGADDGYKSILERKITEWGIEDAVIFTGYLGGKEKQSVLVDADIVIQPSSYEQGLPWSCVEALLCNIPFVVCQNTGASEDAIKMNTGYLVEYGNTNELKDTISNIYSHPDECAQNVKIGRKYVFDHLSIKNKVEEYEKIYLECMNQT